MVKCPVCGKSYPDDIVACADCLETLESDSPSPESNSLSPRKRRSGFVGFCLRVAAIVSFINCIAVPAVAILYCGSYIKHHSDYGIEGMILFLFAILLSPVVFCISVAHIAVFQKVHEMYKNEG
jgi:membrane glycosyltransferase